MPNIDEGVEPGGDAWLRLGTRAAERNRVQQKVHKNGLSLSLKDSDSRVRDRTLEQIVLPTWTLPTQVSPGLVLMYNRVDSMRLSSAVKTCAVHADRGIRFRNISLGKKRTN